ncbi:MAG: hypothetical protein HY951_09665 [Bacteroidia bacterium]|nr:hypothetical protein [Bacteroidia bacterium]
MKPKEILVGITKIKDVEFFIDEQVDLNDSTQITLGFELKTNINPIENTVELLLAAIYSLQSENKVIMKIRTSNIFLIPELATLKKEENVFDIPDDILTTMLSLSITHTRALLAKNAVGTKFADLILPIVNPTDMFKQLFAKK